MTDDEIIGIMARGAWPSVFSGKFAFPKHHDKAQKQSLDEMRAALGALYFRGLTVAPAKTVLDIPQKMRKTDKELMKKLFKLLAQAKEAGYITNEERSMMYEFARRGAERKTLRDKGSLEGNP